MIEIKISIKRRFRKRIVEKLKHPIEVRKKRKIKKRRERIQKTIMEDLLKARRPLTIKQLSDRTKLSWITIKKHLRELEKSNIVKRKSRNSRIYWYLQQLK